ncbi:hypothetical protein [Microbacterium sp.]|uniref:hypothetical protein n=1 Tax=Microbacterium sp. TaxID=51671 RepID=UPI0025E4ACFB|nr:hypothetical protein [Microbacterium sp.]
MTIIGLAPSTIHAARVRVVPIGAQRWRVLDHAGRALGQLVASGEPDDMRYRARRFHPASGTFRDVGDFRRAGEALECLRLLR